MHRIPAAKANAPVIMLQHGISDCSDQWVMNSAELSPAFQLARAGYDVWMGNNRGNYYSDKHTTLDNKSKEYWNFDFEDMGVSDQPAMMDYITETTKQQKLVYIGHSEGTT